MEDGYVIDRPNRAKSSSKTTRAIVVLLLLVSAALQLIIILGGWSALSGSRSLQILYALLYVGMAYLVGPRWNRGVLPVAASLAILLLIFAAVSGPEWFERDKSGFATPESIFGGGGLESSVLGLLTFIVIPVQVLVIGFCAQAFRQDWHVELEVPKSRAKWPGAAPRRIVDRPGQRRRTTVPGA